MIQEELQRRQLRFTHTSLDSLTGKGTKTEISFEPSGRITCSPQNNSIVILKNFSREKNYSIYMQLADIKHTQRATESHTITLYHKPSFARNIS